MLSEVSDPPPLLSLEEDKPPADKLLDLSVPEPSLPKARAKAHTVATALTVAMALMVAMALTVDINNRTLSPPTVAPTEDTVDINKDGDQGSVTF